VPSGAARCAGYDRQGVRGPSKPDQPVFVTSLLIVLNIGSPLGALRKGELAEVSLETGRSERGFSRSVPGRPAYDHYCSTACLGREGSEGALGAIEA
jgi:hypothetical protein